MLVYTWLKSRCGATETDFVSAMYISWDPVYTTDITWNFEMVNEQHRHLVYHFSS